MRTKTILCVCVELCISGVHELMVVFCAGYFGVQVEDLWHSVGSGWRYPSH
jgi:hypothetical protein